MGRAQRMIKGIGSKLPSRETSRSSALASKATGAGEVQVLCGPVGFVGEYCA